MHDDRVRKLWVPKYKATDAVEVQAGDSRWYSAKISTINKSDMSYNITWDDKTLKDAPTNKPEKSIRPPWAPGFKVSDRVEAQADDWQWYAATISAVSVSDRTFTVAWEDPSRKAATVKVESSVRSPLKYKVGDRVEAKVIGDKWLAATVARVNSSDKTYELAWDDDGCRELRRRSEDVMRPRPPPGEWVPEPASGPPPRRGDSIPGAADLLMSEAERKDVLKTACKMSLELDMNANEARR
jgi:hypothetical protein